MADTQDVRLALGDNAARQLANATKTVPQLSTITPRWLVHLLQWNPVEAGIFRLNKVKNPLNVQVACSNRDESALPQTFVDYEDQPREYFLNAVSTILDVHTRVSTEPKRRLRSALCTSRRMLASSVPSTLWMVALMTLLPIWRRAADWLRHGADTNQALIFLKRLFSNFYITRMIFAEARFNEVAGRRG